MNAETCNTHMYFDAAETMPGADPREKREACIEAAIKFGREQGLNEEDASKLRAALLGLPNSKGEIVPGPLALVTWRFYIANVNKLILLQDEIWEPMSGKLAVTGRNGVDYDIVLRPATKDDPQVTLAIGIQKRGNARTVTTSEGTRIAQDHFWTYGGVTCQTDKRTSAKTGEPIPGLPLCLAADITAQLDASGKERELSCRWSRRLYSLNGNDDLTGQGRRGSRLDTLIRGGNDELKFMNAMILAGFPVDTARLRRNQRGGAQWTPQQPQRPQSLAPQPVPAGVSVPDGGSDPFADGE